MMFKAEVILASRNTFGQRITTMLVTMPRIILAELNTHRMFGRNSASSRAIKFNKMADAVMSTPFVPEKWMKDHTGMQGSEYLDEHKSMVLDSLWLEARDCMVKIASQMNQVGLTKQMCNRLLEPFMWHTVLITATEWENFFALRAHPDAEIHMQVLANFALNAYNNAPVQELQPGQWHIPFIDKRLIDVLGVDTAIKVSTALCAQTSYTVVGEDGKALNYDKLVKLHDRLLQSKHMSPFEHCARSMSNTEFDLNAISINISNISGSKGGWIRENGWSKHLRGFIPYRAMIEGENQSDPRVKH